MFQARSPDKVTTGVGANREGEPAMALGISSPRTLWNEAKNPPRRGKGAAVGVGGNLRVWCLCSPVEGWARGRSHVGMGKKGLAGVPDAGSPRR